MKNGRRDDRYRNWTHALQVFTTTQLQLLSLLRVKGQSNSDYESSPKAGQVPVFKENE